MSHDLHEKPRRVLGDDCQECSQRARAGLNGLSALDDTNLERLAKLSREMREAREGHGSQPTGASVNDCLAVETLRLAARLVFRSGITWKDAR